MAASTITAASRRETFLSRFEVGGRARVLPMEGVRGVAALMVFCVHYANHFKAYAAPGFAVQAARWMEVAGQAGVDLFFALSGYLIYGLAMERKGGLGQFLGRRLRRIYPPFLAVLAFYLCVFFLAPSWAKWPAEGRWSYVAANALLLPGVFDMAPAITVAWSLSYELLFYLTAPFAAMTVKGWPRGRRIAFIVLLSALYAAVSMSYFPGKVNGIPLHLFRHPHLLLFAAGMVAWEWRPLLRAPSRWRDFAAVALLIAAVVATVPLADPSVEAREAMYLRAALLGAASVALSLAAYGEPGALARALSRRPLRLLGNASYSFYLIHSVGVHAAAWAATRVFPPEQWQGVLFWGLAAWALGVSAVLAAALFLGVERRWALKR